MTQTQPELKLLTFDEFSEWYPENSLVRYELYDGVIVEMPPATGDHTDIISFLLEVMLLAIQESKLPYRVSASAFVKTLNGKSAYIPDMLLINHDNLIHEPLWKKQSTLIYPQSIPLIIEVVSTNWQDDYYNKIRDYETMGIPEYWIVDYAALGGRKFIGNPKVPTIFVCELIDGEYQMTPFRGADRIVSPTFLQLNLTAQQIFDSVI
ncbi:MAG: Uma2 family endonuclease [Gloeotrichia echinulata IR180]|jgi:Uma2 family endonuclease|nr:Uma2 family endonuclease [Gloeotrichia echinulata DEX184]